MLIHLCDRTVWVIFFHNVLQPRSLVAEMPVPCVPVASALEVVTEN